MFGNMITELHVGPLRQIAKSVTRGDYFPSGMIGGACLHNRSPVGGYYEVLERSYSFFKVSALEGMRFGTLYHAGEHNECDLGYRGPSLDLKEVNDIFSKMDIDPVKLGSFSLDVPEAGRNEILAALLAGVAVGSIAVAALKKWHVKVDVEVPGLNKATQWVMDAVEKVFDSVNDLDPITVAVLAIIVTEVLYRSQSVVGRTPIAVGVITLILANSAVRKRRDVVKVIQRYLKAIRDMIVPEDNREKFSFIHALFDGVSIGDKQVRAFNTKFAAAKNVMSMFSSMREFLEEYFGVIKKGVPHYDIVVTGEAILPRLVGNLTTGDRIAINAEIIAFEKRLLEFTGAYSGYDKATIVPQLYRLLTRVRNAAAGAGVRDRIDAGDLAKPVWVNIVGLSHVGKTSLIKQVNTIVMKHVFNVNSDVYAADPDKYFYRFNFATPECDGYSGQPIGLADDFLQTRKEHLDATNICASIVQIVNSERGTFQGDLITNKENLRNLINLFWTTANVDSKLTLSQLYHSCINWPEAMHNRTHYVVVPRVVDDLKTANGSVDKNKIKNLNDNEGRSPDAWNWNACVYDIYDGKCTQNLEYGNIVADSVSFFQFAKMVVDATKASLESSTRARQDMVETASAYDEWLNNNHVVQPESGESFTFVEPILKGCTYAEEVVRTWVPGVLVSVEELYGGFKNGFLGRDMIEPTWFKIVRVLGTWLGIFFLAKHIFEMCVDFYKMIMPTKDEAKLSRKEKRELFCKKEYADEIIPEMSRSEEDYFSSHVSRLYMIVQSSTPITKLSDAKGRNVLSWAVPTIIPCSGRFGFLTVRHAWEELVSSGKYAYFVANDSDASLPIIPVDKESYAVVGDPEMGDVVAVEVKGATPKTIPIAPCRPLTNAVWTIVRGDTKNRTIDFVDTNVQYPNQVGRKAQYTIKHKSGTTNYNYYPLITKHTEHRGGSCGLPIYAKIDNTWAVVGIHSASSYGDFIFGSPLTEKLFTVPECFKVEIPDESPCNVHIGRAEHVHMCDLPDEWGLSKGPRRNTVERATSAFLAYGESKADIPSDLGDQQIDEIMESIMEDNIDCDFEMTNIEEVIANLDPTTSSGHGCSKYGPGKRKIFFEGKPGPLYEEFCDEVQERLQAINSLSENELARGLGPRVIFEGAVKQELVSDKYDSSGNLLREKTKESRYLSASDVVSTVVGNMAFSSLKDSIIRNSTNSEFVMGIDANGADWENLYRKHSYRNKHFAGDFGKFDRSHLPKLIFAIRDALLLRVDDPLLRKIIIWYFYAIAYSVHDFVGSFWQWVRSMPSGNILTTIINMFLLAFYYRYAYVKKTHLPLSDFQLHITLSLYGDDSLVSTDLDDFTAVTMWEAMGDFNLEYTDHNGLVPKAPGHWPLEELTLLKRGFTMVRGLVRGNLALTSIKSLVEWVRKGDMQVYHFNLITACVELSRHGHDKWKIFFPDIKRQADIHKFTLPSFSQALRAASKGEYSYVSSLDVERRRVFGEPHDLHIIFDGHGLDFDNTSTSV